MINVIIAEGDGKGKNNTKYFKEQNFVIFCSQRAISVMPQFTSCNSSRTDNSQFAPLKRAQIFMLCSIAFPTLFQP